jgi:hypothetical protein
VVVSPNERQAKLKRARARATRSADFGFRGKNSSRIRLRSISAKMPNSSPPMIVHRTLMPGKVLTKVPWNCFLIAAGACPCSSISFVFPE